MANPSKSELLDLARQAIASENYARADECYTLAIRQMQSDDPDFAECLENLVILKQELGDLPSALEYSLRLIKLGEDMLGPDHPLVSQWKMQVAQINAQLGRLNEGAGFPTVDSEQAKTVKTVSTSVDSEKSEYELLNEQRRSTQSNTPLRPATRNTFQIPLPHRDDRQQEQREKTQDKTEEKIPGKAQGKSKADAPPSPVYVSTSADNSDDQDDQDDIDDESLKRSSTVPESSNSARRIQFSEQDMLERERMYAMEARERNDKILRMVLVALTTGILVASVYYCWSLYGIAEHPAAFTKSNPSADNVRYLRYLSNKTIQLGLAERSEKYQYSAFTISLEDFFRSLASAVLSKEFFLQDHGDYIADEDGTTYLNDDCPQQLTVHNMHKVSENCRIYYLRNSKYPRRLVDPDAQSLGIDSKSESISPGEAHASSSNQTSASQKNESSDSATSAETSTPATDDATETTDGSGKAVSASAHDLLNLQNPYTKTLEQPTFYHHLVVVGAAGSQPSSAANSTGGSGANQSTNSASSPDSNLASATTSNSDSTSGPSDSTSRTSSGTIDGAIKEILDNLKAGGSFPEETPLKPGSVSACQYVISGDGHEDSLLVVHGTDENGKLISASGVKKTFLYVQKNGIEVDTADKTSPFGRSFLGIGPRIELRPNFLCVIECRPEFPIPLWILRFRFILPGLISCAMFLVLGKITSDTINRYLAFGMAALSLIAAVLSILNAVCP